MHTHIRTHTFAPLHKSQSNESNLLLTISLGKCDSLHHRLRAYKIYDAMLFVLANMVVGSMFVLFVCIHLFSFGISLNDVTRAACTHTHTNRNVVNFTLTWPFSHWISFAKGSAHTNTFTFHTKHFCPKRNVAFAMSFLFHNLKMKIFICFFLKHIKCNQLI